MITRLQRSWWCDLRDEGLEAYSLLSKKRILLRGDPSSLDRLAEHLINGIEATNCAARLADITGMTIQAVEFILSSLKSMGALVEVSADKNNIGLDTDDTFNRQALFFEMFERQGVAGSDFNERLQSKRIAIIGVGGYGSWIADLCARAGIGNIVIIDHDTVERTNLNRQILYDASDIGRSKVDAAADALGKIDGAIKIEKHQKIITHEEDLRPIVRSCDLIFNTFGYGDGPLVKAISGAAEAAGIPYLTFSGSWIGPLLIPGHSPCFECVRATVSEIGGGSASISNYNRRRSRAHFPSFGPRVGLSSCAAAWEAIRFLADLDRSPTLDGIIVLDTFTYTSHGFINLKDSPGNCICGAQLKSIAQTQGEERSRYA